jgi:excinuclease ABC subunit B
MFDLVSDFKPSGDQPEAIDALLNGLRAGEHNQILQGVTGSGKTFTMANVIAQIDRPTLVLSHNKTLAAQLYSEFKAFFPNNAVEYFISYYDYYLPESYIPQTDTYIAKDAGINENIEKLRLSTTASLLERRDVIVIASVSCIYNLGSPEDYEEMSTALEVGQLIARDEFLRNLIAIQYERNDMAPEKGQFRVRGDTVDVYMPQRDEFIRIEFWGDEVESLTKCEFVSGRAEAQKNRVVFFPCKHFVMPPERIEGAISQIMAEMKERVKWFEERGLLVEAQRLYQRTVYDMEMIREIGYCSGVENYSMYLAGREPGSMPCSLWQFFPKDMLTIIDESHVMIPQVRAMYKADRSRKQTLIDHGFRLPSALDNRPLRFEEFEQLRGNTVFVSATPGEFELELSSEPVRQLIRPTGLLDPEIEVRPLDGQVDDVMAEIRAAAEKHERVIVTTLTKKSSERLAEYLQDLGIKAEYLHSEMDALQRVRVISALRRGDFDCLIGINLLREGIDLPEVALIAILDADKEGFLRSQRALIQVAGRAARNVNGRVILYGDRITNSMQKLIDISSNCREVQARFNQANNIIPRTIKKAKLQTISDIVTPDADKKKYSIGDAMNKILAVRETPAPYGANVEQALTQEELDELVMELETEMLGAAESLEFERAADIRDRIREITKEPDKLSSAPDSIKGKA